MEVIVGDVYFDAQFSKDWRGDMMRMGYSGKILMFFKNQHVLDQPNLVRAFFPVAGDIDNDGYTISSALEEG
jgi:hypothetical protein